MAKNYEIKAEAREVAGKGAARTLRRANKVPGVIYGDGKEPIKITLPAKEMNLEYNKGHMYTMLCNLEVGSDKHLVLARDVQMHVVKDTVEHVDFLRVTKKTKIAVNVPVNFTNEELCPGLIEKGNMNVVRYEVELVCQATNIPESIEVDLTPFNIGDSINISAAVLPDGAKPVIDDRDFTLAVIAAPRTMEELEAEEAAAAAAAAEEGVEGEEAAEGEEKAEGGDEKKED